MRWKAMSNPRPRCLRCGGKYLHRVSDPLVQGVWQSIPTDLCVNCMWFEVQRLRAENALARAENRRLRAALQEVRDLGCRMRRCPSCNTAEWVEDLAAEALGEA